LRNNNIEKTIQQIINSFIVILEAKKLAKIKGNELSTCVLECKYFAGIFSGSLQIGHGSI
jgi:hypothetical protein